MTISIKHLLLLILQMISTVTFAQLPQSTLFNQSKIKSLRNSYNQLNKPYFAFIMINDCNIFLFKTPCKSNDTWYTLGAELDLVLNLKKHNLSVSGSFKSDLFTENIGYQPDKNWGDIKKEIFTEINELGFEFKKIVPSSSLSTSWGLSVGTVNRDRVLKYLALSLQAGMDGQGGYHNLIKQAPKVNVSRNEFQYYLKLSPKINKMVIIVDHEHNPIWLYASIGADMSTYAPLNNINHSLEISIPIIHTGGKLDTGLDLNLSEKTKIHSNGVSFEPTIDVATTFLNRLEIHAATTWPLGQQNFNLTNIKEDSKIEPLMKMKLAWKFWSRN